jgi:hypothetical protein
MYPSTDIVMLNRTLLIGPPLSLHDKDAGTIRNSSVVISTTYVDERSRARSVNWPVRLNAAKFL